MAARRAQFGQITKLPSGRYRARYQVPDSQPRVYVNAPETFTRKADAELWLARQRTDITDGVVRPKVLAVRVTLREYAPRWLEERRNSRGEGLRPSTRRTYQQYLDAYLYPQFGDTALPKISRDDVKAWWTGFHPEHPTLRAKVYALLRTILNTAVEEEKIPSNPAQIRGAGQVRPAARKVIATPAQVDALADAMPEALALAVQLGAWCQMRSGEVLALRRRDISPERVSITRTVTWVAGEPSFGPPKTDAGERDIAVPPHIAGTVRAHMLAHAAPGPDGLLFPAHPGEARPIHQNTYGYHFGRAVEAVGLPKGFRHHWLRHTGLTWTGQVGGTVAELQARAGHSTPAMALHYQHGTRTRDEALAEALSEQIAGKGGKGKARKKRAQ